jgi:S-adenosylmethionine-diacylglycerol 3-amino-3-carboxypropyl transferase
MLRGRFPSGIFYPWLDAPVPTRLPELEWTVTGMAEALRSWPGQFDFIHLSNILDWLAPETARATLDLAWRALRPGGWAFLRQLNSSLDIEALGGRFAWQTRPAEALFRRDRSFFYRGLHLGIKR